MMRGTTIAALIVAAIAVLPGSSNAQEFEWQGRVDRGDGVEIKGINGDIDATYTSGSEVRVRAEKKGRDDDPSEVRIEVVEHGDGVTICAVYPDDGGRKNECKPGDAGHLSSRDNDVSVHFVVEVPAGVEFRANTVNGGVDAAGLQSDIRASTVNGGINLSTSGLAKANTVNGSIKASMGRADWTGDLDFNTVNGSITVEMPANAGARVKASTVNGGLETDFPLTIQGKFSNRKMEGTIGGGGRDLSLETVNGSIRLKKSG
ncbi:MAG: DUF4097 family beta strand repeat-containing protein [marine benthic group bacterium]|nr:DUF4097 family beta strand repeat-containing protein [Gemmatimonadota bacterium]